MTNEQRYKLLTAAGDNIRQSNTLLSNAAAAIADIRNDAARQPPSDDIPDEVLVRALRQRANEIGGPGAYGWFFKLTLDNAATMIESGPAQIEGDTT